MELLKKHWPISVLAILYLVGTLGFLLEMTQGIFSRLTWLTLLISFILLVRAHHFKDLFFKTSLLIVGLAGYFLEVAGVQTGVLFGEYTYGAALGLKIWDTPLMIGVNWAMLVYMSSVIARKFTDTLWKSALIGGALMVFMDILIEPFAIQFDLWTWTVGHVPAQNYLMWFIAGSALNYFFQRNNPSFTNPVAIPLFGIMMAFFLIINLVVL